MEGLGLGIGSAPRPSGDASQLAAPVAGFRVSSFEFRVSDFGFRVSDFGFRVLDFGLQFRV